jgi:SAM-dependent methyltransferase
MACIVCGTPQAAGLAGWHASCHQCGYESAALQGTINEKTAASPVDEDERELGLKALRQENFRDIVQIAQRLARPGARRLLDVGCAHGWFLETARERFEVLGVEPDAVVGGRTAARGLPVRQGYFPDALMPGETFDVIVFNDVIEHIPDIRAALDACHARLQEGGLLILNLPNSAGFFYRLSKIFARIGWRSPFERLVAKHGFERVHSGELPSLRAKGLLERIRCAGNISGPSLYLQYAAVLCAIPLLRVFPSDIIVSVFRKT